MNNTRNACGAGTEEAARREREREKDRRIRRPRHRVSPEVSGRKMEKGRRGESAGWRTIRSSRSVIKRNIDSTSVYRIIHIHEG